MCKQLHCTTVHLLVPAWAITNVYTFVHNPTHFAVSQSVLQNRFTELRPSEITLMNRIDQSQESFDLPASLWLVLLGVAPRSLIVACWHSPSALQNGLCKKKSQIYKGGQDEHFIKCLPIVFTNQTTRVLASFRLIQLRRPKFHGGAAEVRPMSEV
jgi:hypothetical protein